MIFPPLPLYMNVTSCIAQSHVMITRHNYNCTRIKLVKKLIKHTVPFVDIAIVNSVRFELLSDLSTWVVLRMWFCGSCNGSGG